VKVHAGKDSDLVFIPRYTEHFFLKREFGAFIYHAGEGYKFKVYQVTHRLLIKKATYVIDNKKYIVKKTRNFKTVTSALKSLGLAVRTLDGKIKDASKGFIMNTSSVASYDRRGFVIRGIPQMYGVYRLNEEGLIIILGINGDYDFKTGLFKGILLIENYDTFLKRGKL